LSGKTLEQKKEAKMAKFSRRLSKMFRSGEKGFTLIELLVVIAILGAIAGVVVLNVGQFMGRGCTQAAATELHNMQTATAAYMVDSTGNAPPADSAALVTAGLILSAPHGSYTINQSSGAVTQTHYTPCLP
jgi:prepilin-type N-terminal cleavage/methylation domain-containing protein